MGKGPKLSIAQDDAANKALRRLLQEEDEARKKEEEARKKEVEARKKEVARES